MKRISFATLAVLVMTIGQPAMSAAQAQSGFLPAVGETVRYRYTDTNTRLKRTHSSAATLTLTAITGNKIRVEVGIDGGSRRAFQFRVDQDGLLELISAPDPTAFGSTKSPSSGQAEDVTIAPALLLRLGVVSRICIHLNEETSFSALLYAPWANAPMIPILSVTPNGPNAFVADAHDTTLINSPLTKSQIGKSMLVYRLISIGVGAGVGAIGGPVGAGVGAALGVTISIIQFHNRPKPVPTDVTLHMSGRVIDGHLQAVSGDEEYVSHVKRRTRTASDQWSLVTVDK